MVKDFIDSIRVSLYSRVTSPLSGAFLVSWAAWNHRLLIVLVSGETPREKFRFIDSVLYPNVWWWGLLGFLCPLATAAFLIFLYPLPAKFVFGYSRRQQRDLKKLRQEIEDETPLTLEQSIEIKREMYRIQGEHASALAKRDSEFERQKELIDFLESTLAAKRESEQPRSPEPIVSNELQEEHLAILKQIAKYGGEVHEGAVLSNAAMGEMKAKWFIQDLQERGLVDQYQDREQDTILVIQQGGRKTLIDLDLID